MMPAPGETWVCETYRYMGVGPPERSEVVVRWVNERSVGVQRDGRQPSVVRLDVFLRDYRPASE